VFFYLPNLCIMGNSKKRGQGVKRTKSTPSTDIPPKTKRWNVPSGSTTDMHGNLVPPGASSSRQKSQTSITSMTASQSSRISNDQPLKVSKVKPIVVDESFPNMNGLLDDLGFEPRPYLKIIRSGENPRTKIVCAAIEQKLELIKIFTHHSLKFHTYSEPGNRVKLFVLKGCFYTTCEKLKEILIDNEIPVTKVSFLADNSERPIFLVHSTSDDLNIQMLIKNHKDLYGLLVHWETYDFRRKRPMPCRWCKMWGHSAINCKRPWRCIKCDKTHEFGNCERKDRQSGELKCCNCKGNHPANSTKCPSYIKYIESNQRRRRSHQKTNNLPFITDESPSFNRQRVPIHFNKRDSRNTPKSEIPSYSETLRTSLHSNADADRIDLIDLQRDFQSIPNIGDTLKKFAKMILELKSHDESEHLMILMKYCSPKSQN
jgi:hypothetical protein